jgi:ABC-2 type transport system permease protein
MRSLVRVELTRLRWRRAVLLLLAAVVAVPVLFGVALDTRPPSAEDRAAAVRQAEEDAAQPYVREDVQRCQERPEDYRLSPDETDLLAACEEVVVPRPEWYIYSQELDLVAQRDETGLAVVVVIVSVLLLLAGTTFVGHDWNSGSMSNQLLFEPRRVRVWTAKALVVLLVSLVLSAVVLAGYWLALWSLARSRDLPASNQILLDCLQEAGRGALVAGFAAFGGYALTMLFRSTVATLGALFAVAVAGGALIAVLGIDESLQPQVNLAAVVLDGATYYVEVPEECFAESGPPEGVDCDQEKVRPAEDATLYLGTTVVLAGAASVLAFRRRDVP